jgi:hypothetical protein
MITITFNPQNADQVQVLAWAMTKLLEPAADEPAVKEEAPAKKPKAAKPTPTPEPEPAPVETAPTISIEDVRKQLVLFRESGKSLKDLFETVGCKHLTEVPPERYAELLSNSEKM